MAAVVHHGEDHVPAVPPRLGLRCGDYALHVIEAEDLFVVHGYSRRRALIRVRAILRHKKVRDDLAVPQESGSAGLLWGIGSNRVTAARGGRRWTVVRNPG
jgi:hypothetical protein